MALLLGRGHPLVRLAAGTADRADGEGAGQIQADAAFAATQSPAAAVADDRNADRSGVLIRALEASVTGNSTVIKDLYTSDVKGWSPALTVSSAVELAVELEDQDSAFSDPVLSLCPLDVAGDRACVEWTAVVTHSGPITSDDDVVLEPTGARCRLHGVTVAEFDGDRIRSFRQYSDETEVLTQLALPPPS